MNSTLFVVAKQPIAGRAKTRLCPPLDGETAAALYACFLGDILTTMRSVAHVRRCIAYLPDDADSYFAALAPDMDRVAQRGAALGARLDNLLTDALSAGAPAAVVMSSDSPTLPAASIAEAFIQLQRGADVVLGPCDDGGYYLIGLRAPQPRLLHEVPMSTPTVLADTLALAAEMRLRVALLSPWYDVDTANDLARLQAELLEAPADVAPQTRAFLQEQFADARFADHSGAQ
ncbi:MAG TPA: TIGR04282 family arsenosugar biosynthesis glycosyltransferase [Roseiflexaceae bacterium]|nr:TIGR04282 family arsenosugar biosynthesis glycosyltransferase [Roseiflexaceae bacterium]HMP41690.1 TIGR04282 family arsenosugar biosynthesis glycosyltransferase [Roseiflexaceae bacterium]